MRSRAEGQDAAALHAALALRDPETAAQLRPSDSQRIIRALEVLEATGLPLIRWQRQERAAPILPLAEVAAIVVAPARDELRARAARRFEMMLEQGALAEVETLLSRGLDPALPVVKALGVAPLAAHLRGEMPLAAAKERAVADTRRYIKRQFTWLRGRMADWNWAAPERAEEIAVRMIAGRIPG